MQEVLFLDFFIGNYILNIVLVLEGAGVFIIPLVRAILTDNCAASSKLA